MNCQAAEFTTLGRDLTFFVFGAPLRNMSLNVIVELQAQRLRERLVDERCNRWIKASSNEGRRSKKRRRVEGFQRRRQNVERRKKFADDNRKNESRTFLRARRSSGDFTKSDSYVITYSNTQRYTLTIASITFVGIYVRAARKFCTSSETVCTPL